MMTDKSQRPSEGQFLVYQAEDGKLKIDVRFEGESVWLAQQQMAELFQTTKQNISLHIQNIYEEQELEREPTVKESLTVQQEGNRSVRRRVELYNLDVVSCRERKYRRRTDNNERSRNQSRTIWVTRTKSGRFLRSFRSICISGKRSNVQLLCFHTVRS